MPRSDDRLPSLEHLQSEIDQAKSNQASADPAQALSSGQGGFSEAMRLANTLITASLVGAGLGYLADRWLGSAPIGLIAGFFLGFAAGLINLMRAVNTKHGSDL